MHLQHTHLTLYEQNWVLITDQMTSSLCMMLYQAHATVGEEGQVGMLSQGSVADAGCRLAGKFWRRALRLADLDRVCRSHGWGVARYTCSRQYTGDRVSRGSPSQAFQSLPTSARSSPPLAITRTQPALSQPCNALLPPPRSPPCLVLSPGCVRRNQPRYLRKHGGCTQARLGTTFISTHINSFSGWNARA